MSEIKSSLIKLLENQSKYRSLVEMIKKEIDLQVESFPQHKEDFLEVHEIYLSTNKEMGKVVNGLEELLYSIKKSDQSTILINIIQTKNLSVGIYTNQSYSVLFGVV